jgi:hypothetical protein
MADPTAKAPLGFRLVLVLVGLYLLVRLGEGAVCVGDWVFDWGSCPW